MTHGFGKCLPAVSVTIWPACLAMRSTCWSLSTLLSRWVQWVKTTSEVSFYFSYFEFSYILMQYIFLNLWKHKDMTITKAISQKISSRCDRVKDPFFNENGHFPWELPSSSTQKWNWWELCSQSNWSGLQQGSISSSLTRLKRLPLNTRTNITWRF